MPLPFGNRFSSSVTVCTFIDTDNDNDQDLIIATTLGIIFMENDGRANYTVKHTELFRISTRKLKRRNYGIVTGDMLDATL